jgi:hypothetical protein
MDAALNSAQEKRKRSAGHALGHIARGPASATAGFDGLEANLAQLDVLAVSGMETHHRD